MLFAHVLHTLGANAMWILFLHTRSATRGWTAGLGAQKATNSGAGGGIGNRCLGRCRQVFFPGGGNDSLSFGWALARLSF